MPDTEHRANPLSQVLGPFTRTGGFYARSWGTYLDRQPDELPVARPTIALAAQAFRDEILLAGFSLLRSAPNATTLERIDREVLAAQDFYGDRGWLENPEGFFAPPPPGSLRGFRQCRASTVDLLEHLLDVGGRELVTCCGTNGAQFGVEITGRLALARLTQCATNPLRDRRAMPARNRLELNPLLCIEENLESLTHAMSMNESSESQAWSPPGAELWGQTIVTTAHAADWPGDSRDRPWVFPCRRTERTADASGHDHGVASLWLSGASFQTPMLAWHG